MAWATAWLLPCRSRESYYTAFSLSIHPRDFFTRRIMKKMREYYCRAEIYIRSSCKLEVVLHKFATCPFFTLLQLDAARPSQADFFSMDPGKKVTHAKNRRRPLNWLCSSIRSWSCLQWFFSLAKFFLEEMLGEKLKSLLKIYGNTLTVILATREMKMISFTTKVSLACLSLYIWLPTWIS